MIGLGVAVVLVLVATTIGATGVGSRVRTRSPATRSTQTPATTKPPAPTTAPPPSPVWRVAWGSAMAWGYGTASDVTVRDLATLGVGGEAVRIRVSNLFGNAPLVISAATIGLDSGGAAVVPGSLHTVTFGGQPGTTVAVGRFAYSDPVAMPVSPMQTVAISLYVSDTDLATVHPCCTKTVSYYTPNGRGNLTQDVTGAGLIPSPWERWADAVDVLQTTGRGSIVVVGDSITDGYHSTLRWTHVLQERIDQLPPSEQRAVVNEGITANALTSVVHTYAATGGGPSGLSRLAPDALEQSGATEVVLFLGTNDLWFGATAAQVIQGYQQAIQAAHQAGLRIVGVTLLPRESNPEEPWTPEEQGQLEQVDRWILTSGQFDGVLDLAAAVADVYNGACAPYVMFPPYDSGDHLHPNAAGQTAMANAVDPSVLELPPLPTVPPLVDATPTANCNAAAVYAGAPQ